MPPSPTGYNVPAGHIVTAGTARHRLRPADRQYRQEGSPGEV